MIESKTTSLSSGIVEPFGAMPKAEARASAPSGALPAPLSPASSDDLMTALAMLSMQQLHEERGAADQERNAAAKAHEEAQAEKISKMRKLADDTFKEGVIEGVLGGVGAAASMGGATSTYEGTMTSSPALTRDGKLLQAASDAVNASSKFGGASAKADQENDRTDTAVADASVERAKAAIDAASTSSRRASDDIRETLNAIRQYLAAKTQLANAAIIKG